MFFIWLHANRCRVKYMKLKNINNYYYRGTWESARAWQLSGSKNNKTKRIKNETQKESFLGGWVLTKKNEQNNKKRNKQTNKQKTLIIQIIFIIKRIIISSSIIIYFNKNKTEDKQNKKNINNFKSLLLKRFLKW